MYSQRQSTQEVRIRMQGKRGDDFEAMLDSRDRGHPRETLRWSNAQGGDFADGAVEWCKAERGVRRSRLQGQRTSSRRSRCLHLRTERVKSQFEKTPETPVSNRAGVWAHKSGSPDGQKLSVKKRRRQDQRIAERMRMELAQALAHFLFVHF